MEDVKNTLERTDINQANRADNTGEGCKCNVFKGLHDWLSVFGFDMDIIRELLDRAIFLAQYNAEVHGK